MCKLNMFSIRNRINSLNEPINEGSFNVRSIYDRVSKKSYSKDNCKYLLEHWRELDTNSNLAFNKLLDVFDLVCENGSIGDINTFSRIIAEESVPKVRSGQQAADYVKNKTRRFKTKLSTKFNTKITNSIAAVADTTGQITNKIKTKNPVTTSTVSKKENKQKDAAVEEAYNRILESIDMQIQCDRVISNYNMISKYYNLDKSFKEAGIVENAVDELCDLICRFRSSSEVKYNTALESSWYVINKNHLVYETKELVDHITDYFLLREDYDESDLKGFAYVLSNSKFFLEEELCDAYSLVSESKDVSSTETVEEALTGINFDNELKAYIESGKTDQVKNMLNKFKKDKKKTPDKLKAIISKFYVLQPHHIIDGTPSILNLLRQFVVLSTLAINPILFCVTALADHCVKLHFRRKETEKIIAQYKREKEKTEKKLKTVKSEATKKRLEEYLKELDKSLQKLEDYFDSIHTEEENDERHAAEWASDDSDDFDFDWGDDDFSLESAQLNDILDIMVYSESLIDIPDTFEKDLINCIPKLSLVQLESVIKFTCISNGIINKRNMVNELQEYRDYLRDNKIRNIPGITSIISNGIYDIETSNNYDYSLKEYTILNNAIREMVDLTKYAGREELITEMNFTNTIKLAADKFKKMIVKASDSEKKMSMTVDSSLNTLRDTFERALRNDNREAIIRGSMLPSASKIIKAALVTGGVALVNPAIAVIGAIGAFACNKRLKAKERQLVVDDIDIELKMCEKYIRNAEDNNDMEALKRLYTIQRNLQRQKQRIEYRMKVDFNQKVPNAANSKGYDDDDY